jgi:hypothetical protein
MGRGKRGITPDLMRYSNTHDSIKNALLHPVSNRYIDVNAAQNERDKGLHVHYPNTLNSASDQAVA